MIFFVWYDESLLAKKSQLQIFSLFNFQHDCRFSFSPNRNCSRYFPTFFLSLSWDITAWALMNMWTLRTMTKRDIFSPFTAASTVQWQSLRRRYVRVSAVNGNFIIMIETRKLIHGQRETFHVCVQAFLLICLNFSALTHYKLLRWKIIVWHQTIKIKMSFWMYDITRTFMFFSLVQFRLCVCRFYFPPHNFSLSLSMPHCFPSNPYRTNSSCRWLRAMCVSWKWINPVHHYSHFLSTVKEIIPLEKLPALPLSLSCIDVDVSLNVFLRAEKLLKSLLNVKNGDWLSVSARTNICLIKREEIVWFLENVNVLPTTHLHTAQKLCSFLPLDFSRFFAALIDRASEEFSIHKFATIHTKRESSVSQPRNLPFLASSRKSSEWLRFELVENKTINNLSHIAYICSPFFPIPPTLVLPLTLCSTIRSVASIWNRKPSHLWIIEAGSSTVFFPTPKSFT